MEFLLIGVIFVCVVILISFYLLFRKIAGITAQRSDQTLLQWLQSMQSTMEVTNKHINDTLQNNSVSMARIMQENARQLHERLDKAAEAMRDVNREVGKMSEIGRNMRELQDFLKSPKLRGNIGEQVLTDLISQVFPKNSFHLQYQFRSGDKVDAAIKTDAGILPIDAKFPMDNFQKFIKADVLEDKERFRKDFFRDVKKHIDTIAKKYVLPDEGTMDFALMYIPSESIYYEVVNADDLLIYARDKRIYLVSPSTLYAHLQTILLSFEGRKIESRSREVFQLIRAIKIDYEKVNDSLETLGKHITNASGQYGQVVKGFTTIGQKLETTKQIGQTIQEEMN